MKLRELIYATVSKSTTQFPGNTLGIPSRSGSNGQTQLTQRYFNDPIFNQVCCGVEARGNPIDDSDTYFTPQNGGTTPTDADRSRYAMITFYDYQKDTEATVQADAVLQAQLGLTSTQIGELIDFVNDQMTATDGSGGIPAGFQMGLGDVNGDGTGSGTGNNAQHLGNIVEVQYPSVRQLVPNTGGGDPWIWATQDRIGLFTSNNRGQQTTYTDSEGNLTVYVRYPENDPEGAGQFLVPTLSNQQYGFVKEVHVDADPATVMTLVGSEGDLIAFTGDLITRTNTPGVYQDLVTRYQPSGTGGGCTSCAYDPLGNPLSTTDPRGNTTRFDRNELGEVYRVTSPAPYSYLTETSYDANGNVTQVDIQDQQVRFDSDDPADPAYAQFTPTGSTSSPPGGSTANVPMKPGPGGAIRPGWFSNLYSYDLLNNNIEQDIDATGSVPSSLVATYAYDFNQNLVKITKPMGNLVEYDYDERNMKIAVRIGYDPANGNPGAVTIFSFDGDRNLIDTVGPAERGSPSQSLSVIIEDAFGGSVAQTFTGDWVVENAYDGFDRLISATDAVGGTTANTFDPGGRTIAAQINGAAGGTTPTNRTGSGNVTLSSSETYFDEAGRAYDMQRDVFLNTTSGNSVPSGRTISHIGGGLATNSTHNNHSLAINLTTGESSYVLSRQVFDRSGRVYVAASDNKALTTYSYDGANRQIGMTDPLGNQAQNTFDANGNLVQTVRVEKCTISGVSTTESFASASFHDVMNRLTVMALQGPDGSFTPSLALATCASWATLGVSCPPWCTTTGTIFTFTGYDSRGNRAVSVDPNANTTVLQYDGASRQTRTLQHLRADGSGSEAVVDVVTTTTNYDADSRLIRLIDDNGGTTAWTYDTLDRQTVMTFHDGSTRTSVYDLANDVIGYTDENGSVFANTYDVLGRKTAVAITLAANVVGTTAQSFEYDGLSRMTFCQDAVGATNADVGFAFDSLGRGMEEDQTYDSDARYVTHDVWASLTSIDLTYPNGRQVASEFDALYRRNGVSETSSGFIAFWRFFGNRTATVALGNGITCSFMNNAQTHSAVQASVSLPAWGDNTTDRLGYDGSGRLIAKRYLPTGSTTSLVGFTSAYDPSSNKLFERALHAESRSALYPSYDSMDRLLEYQRGVLASGGVSITTPISLPGANQEQDYDLDGLGNWTSTTLTPEGGTASVQTRTHNKLNELLAFGVSPASTPVLYDHGNNASSNPLIAQRGNGNIVDDGTRLYAYDALNRLTTVKKKSTSATIGQYTYDALGRRVQKIVTNGGVSGTVANATYRYLLDATQEVEELSGGSTLRQFVWGRYVDELIQMKTYANTGTQPLAAGTYYPLQDLLYRTTATTDSSGSIVEAYDYDAYGNTLTYAGPGTDGQWFTDDDAATLQPACEYLFTGRQYDPESQIYFYRARYYQPTVGRFVSRDILELPTSMGCPTCVVGVQITSQTYPGADWRLFGHLNLYEYARSNPIWLSDPMGLTPFDPSVLVGLIGGFAVGCGLSLAADWWNGKTLCQSSRDCICNGLQGAIVGGALTILPGSVTAGCLGGLVGNLASNLCRSLWRCDGDPPYRPWSDPCEYITTSIDTAAGCIGGSAFDPEDSIPKAILGGISGLFGLDCQLAKQCWKH